MKLILQDKNKYVLKAGVGEEVMGELKAFCAEQGVESASFFAIGAAKEIKLGWYDVEVKEYTWKEVQEKLEIVSLLGNIATMEKEILVHAHGSFSGKNMQVMGGHVTKLVVGAACEIFFTKYEGKIEKAYDEETGLNLMQ
jgi:uncharacterized protein